MVAGKVLKVDTRNAFKIIKWVVLVYAGLNICYYVVVYFTPAAMDSFLGKARGTYDFSFYLMFVPNTILPLFLLFKKLGHNKYVLLTLSFLMNAGWLLELFALYNTDFHREYVTSLPLSNYLWLVVLKGFFIGSVIYAIGNSFNRKTSDIHTSIS